MNNNLSKIISQVPYFDIVKSSFSYGKYGMIFSKQFDNVIKGHDDSIRLTFKILYRDYLPIFHKNIDIIVKNAPVQACFVDRAEMIYSIFLASIGEISFLDSTEGKFNSGLFFLPEDFTTLTPQQLQATYLFIEEIMKKTKSQKNVPLYEVMLVPSFEIPEKNCTFKTLDALKKEIDTFYLNTKKKSIS